MGGRMVQSRFTQQVQKAKQLIACVSALVLAAALVPILPATFAFAEDSATTSSNPSIDSMLAAGPFVEGEALVVYRDDAAGQSRSRATTPDQALGSAGFSLETTWDFSGVANTNSGGEGEAVQPFSLEAEPASDNVYIAQVVKPNATTAELLEELQGFDFVVAAAPNYLHESPVTTAEQDDIAPAETTEPLPATEEEKAAIAPEVPEAPRTGEAPAAPITLDGTEVEAGSEGSAPTNDPLFGFQWALDNKVQLADGTPVDSDVNFSELYAQASQGEENIIAVVDMGVDYTNEDLADAMWVNPGDIGLPGKHGYDFSRNDDDPMPESSDLANSHGTHCAGIIAASANNGTGITGVAPKTKIIALKITPSAYGIGLADSAILGSYEYVLKAKLAGQNVVAVSNSWVAAITSKVTEFAIEKAGQAGILSVFGAGNDNTDTGTSLYNGAGFYASDSPYILAAAATSVQRVYATYTSHSHDLVEVATPGSAILSPVATGSQTYLPAIAQMNDQKKATPGAHSLYYNNLADFSLEKAGLEVSLTNAEGTPLDQNRLTLLSGTGLDGRSALRADIQNVSKGDKVRFTWSVINPLKGKDWAAAQNMQVAILPGVSIDEQGTAANGILKAGVMVDVLDAAGASILMKNTDLGAPKEIVSSTDSRNAESWSLTAEGFDRIKNDDTLKVTVDIRAHTMLDSSQTRVGSLTLADFGMGFAEGLPYSYMGGTSMACPLAAGSIGLLASLYPEETPLQLRGRLVGGTKSLNDANAASAGVAPYPFAPGTYDRENNPKATASRGMLDLPTAASPSEVHPNTWGANVSDGTTLVIEGYALNRATSVSIDGEPLTTFTAADDGSSLQVEGAAAVLDGGRHQVLVSDGRATHEGNFTLPLVDQRLAFVKVTEVPQVPTQAADGSPLAESGALVAAGDRLFFRGEYGNFLSSFDPEGDGTWVRCTSPVEAGYDPRLFQATTELVYADGKLYTAVEWTVETGDPLNPVDLAVGLLVYDIESDTWAKDPIVFADPVAALPSPNSSAFGIASYNGNVAIVLDDFAGKVLSIYNPKTNEQTSIAVDESTDPSGSLTPLLFAHTLPTMQVGTDLVFGGLLEDDAKHYQLALARYDGTAFSVPSKGAAAPPGAPAQDLVPMKQYLQQGIAASGDAVLFSGASAEGLGDTYQFNLATNTWEPLGIKMPGGSSAPRPYSACFYRGSYYVLGASESNAESTVLYRSPQEVTFTPSDYTASAQAATGGTVAVSQGPEPAKAQRVAAASERVEHVAIGDSVTWRAVPDEGFVFAGWYTQDSSLVSKDASYTQPITATIALTAQFVAGAGPDPGPGPGPDPDPKPLPDNKTPQGTQTLVSTGDPLAGALALVGLGATGALAVMITSFSTRRKRH